MNAPLLLSQTYPGGCFIGFNAAIDRKAAEQLALMCGDAVKNRFSAVNLLLSSVGGTLDHTYYLCSVLDALPIDIVTFNIGNVMSAANLLFLCGKQRYAIEGSTFYFHQTHYPPPSDQVSASFVRSRAKSIARDDVRSATFIANKIGVPIKDVMKWQRSELFMDTARALTLGIIHGVKAPVITPNAFFLQLVV
jgi:ATP-dependent protease ClpP protease subunit